MKRETILPLREKKDIGLFMKQNQTLPRFKHWGITPRSMLFFVVVLLVGHLNALVDLWFHPEIPFYDEEHLMAGTIFAFLAALSLRGIKRYMDRLEQALLDRKDSEEALRRNEEAATLLAKENSILAEIGRIISSTFNIGEVYERFEQEVRKLIPFDRIGVSLHNIQEGTVTLVYVSGTGIPGREIGNVLPLADTVNSEILRTKSSLLIDMENRQEWERKFPALSPTLDAGHKSLMFVPLISKGEIIGVLLLRAYKPGAFTEKDVKLAEKVASQIAGTIANARLFGERVRAVKALRKSEEEARRLARENAAVAEIGRIISSTLDIEEVYERFAAEVRKLIAFDGISVNLINYETGTVRFSYASGVSVEGRHQGDSYSLSGSVAEEVIRTRSGVIVRIEKEGEWWNRFPALLKGYAAGLRSLMVVPLISKDQVIGTIHFRSTRSDSFSKQDLKVAGGIASQIAGAVANAQLFMEWKRVEEALRESERRFRDLFDNAPLGYHEYDGEGHVTKVNRTEERMLGYGAEEMVGRPMWEFNGETDFARQQILAKLAGTMPPGRNIERTYRKKDGTLLHVLLEDKLISDEKGQIKGIRCAVQDITEWKRVKEEVVSLQEQLRQSQKMEAIGRLAGGVAHDFNNLLTIIKGYSQLSLAELNEKDPLKGNIETIQKAAERAADLTRQLLAFSRRQIMELRVLDLNSLLKDMEKMLHRVIGEDIELVTLLAENLGRVKADPGQIEQVVMNLAVNARDAMPSGGKLLVETADAERDEAYVRSHEGMAAGRYVMFSVSDTGVGMPPELREKIFDPFFTTKEKGKGTGLGLSMVYGIVKQTGGNIFVYSEPGRGSVFKVYLPRVEEETSALAPRYETLSVPRGNETVLLVEDEQAVRNLAARVLREQSYHVLEASDGNEALLLAENHREERIHILVTDVVMPQMGGRELADRLRTLRPGIKVLFTSGYTDNAIVHHGALDHGVEFLQKPFSPSALGLKVRKVLDNG